MQWLSHTTNLEGKRVLVRVDMNVPMEDGIIKDDIRIRAALPTIEYLVDHGAVVILLAHLGRPDGKVVEELRLQPIADRLSEFLDQDVDVLKEDVWWGVNSMKPGTVVMIENIRFFPGEEAKDPGFIQGIAALGELYVQDAFGVSHRDHASLVGIAEQLPRVGGFLLQKELEGLDAVKNNPVQPLVVVMGGAKIQTKLPVVNAFVGEAQHILLGGALVNTVLKQIGYGVGDSKVDDIDPQIMKPLQNDSVALPVDLIVGKADGTGARSVKIGPTPHEICGEDEGIFDIGPETVELYMRHIQAAKTVVMNGAMGLFEQEPYDAATNALTRAVAEQSVRGAYTVIGGGETVRVAQELGVADKINLVSTGGGAMLAYLAGDKLPALCVLEQPV